MAKPSGSNRAAPLKTYSRRVNITTEKPPGKRKLSEDSQAVVELPPAKKIARTSIQSYFQPLSSSSSPAPTRSSLQSSDDLDPGSTPPSSPPSDAARSPGPKRKTLRKPKRRISTRTQSVAVSKMPSNCDRCVEDCDCPSSTSDIVRSSLIPCKPSPHRFAVPVTAVRLLKQTQLMLGDAKTVVFCAECQTHYNPTIEHDRRVHADRHAEIVALGSGSLNFQGVTIATHVVGLDQMLYIKITPNDAPRLRSFASRVVKMVDEQLNFVKSKELWQPGKYIVVFIVLLNDKPIGALVAGPVSKAGGYSREYDPGVFGGWTEELSEEVVSTDINMCIDRLWVHPDHRGGVTHGTHFAGRLMDLARGHFIPHYHVPKTKIAFSSPTSDGYWFACKYFKGAFELDPQFKGKGVKMLVGI